MGCTAVRLKWHMLRRRKADPAFLRENLVAALAEDAACEVDLVLTRDGHALCLHDRTLDRETTGTGAVADTTRIEIERLRQRGSDGAPLASTPLFLDEIVAMASASGTATPALVQLDVKMPADALTAEASRRIGQLLRDRADLFIASAYDWEAVCRLRSAVPGLHAGFDPLTFYPRTLDLDADGFRAVAARMFATAPGASMYYLEAKLVLAALAHGVDLVDTVTRTGARVDAWTIDADHPELANVLRRLIDAGCHQVTSNDPVHLTGIVGAMRAGARR